MHATMMAAWPAGAFADITPHPAAGELSTSLRRAGRALAADAGRRTDRARVAEATWPIVGALRADLRDWQGQGATVQELDAAWTRIVDAAVLEAYRMARFQSGQTPSLRRSPSSRRGPMPSGRSGPSGRSPSCWWFPPTAASSQVAAWPGT